MKTSLSRRTVLRHLAGAAAALPLINVIKYPEAYAAGSVAPLRLVTVWAPFQVPEIFFHPHNAAGALATAGTDLVLSYANSSTAALDRYKSKMIVFRGLKYGMALGSHSSNAIRFTGSAPGQPDGRPDADDDGQLHRAVPVLAHGAEGLADSDDRSVRRRTRSPTT